MDVGGIFAKKKHVAWNGVFWKTISWGLRRKSVSEDSIFFCGFACFDAMVIVLVLVVPAGYSRLYGIATIHFPGFETTICTWLQLGRSEASTVSSLGFLNF